MAIFGSFSDMPLPEVLSVVGRGSGRFVVRNHPSADDLELHIFNGTISGMFVNAVEVEDVLALRNRMLALIKIAEGEFEFTKAPREMLLQRFQTPLDQIILSCLAAIDEIGAYRDHFPSQFTYFEATDENATVWLDPEFEEFWRQSRSALLEGANAREISRDTGMDLDQVLLFLFKLRSSGVVKPVRRVARPTTRRPSSEMKVLMSIVSESPAEYLDSHEGQDLRNVKTAAPRVGLMRRMACFIESCFRVQG